MAAQTRATKPQVNLIAPCFIRHLRPQNKLPAEILIDPRDIARAPGNKDRNKENDIYGGA